MRPERLTMYSFEWDAEKNRINREKHGVTFEEAQTVFYDEYALLEYDEAHSTEEGRFRILGISLKGNILLVVHCVRAGNMIRIISSRMATKREREGYIRSRARL